MNFITSDNVLEDLVVKGEVFLPHLLPLLISKTEIFKLGGKFRALTS